MAGNKWLAIAVLAGVLSGTGCICCDHRASKLAVNAGPDCAYPLADRQHVYLFMVNGITPGSTTGLNGLRDELARQGFMKVAMGQTIHALWMRKEMVRIHAEDPAARFVVLGFDIGCTVATRLAAQAQIDGLPVDSVILLDPPGNAERADSAVPSLVIRSGSGLDPAVILDGAVIPDARHSDLPSHPVTVSSVVRLLGEVTVKVEHGTVYVPVSTSDYEHAPPAKIIATPGPDASAEWNFLLDVPGSHGDRLAPVNAPMTVRQNRGPVITSENGLRTQP